MEVYLNGCRNSPKYRQGEWCVLEHSSCGLVSSLLIHKFKSDEYGIGSIATPLEMRKNGWASFLIESVLESLEKDRKANVVYLYSDINPEFYRRFGFVVLPENLQKCQDSVCMVRFKKDSKKTMIDNLQPPTYF